MKIRPFGTELLLADGRTDGQTGVTKLIVVFRGLANATESALQTLEIEPRLLSCLARRKVP